MQERENEQIIQIPMGSSHAYLVVNGQQAVLVDAGLKNKEQQVVTALRNLDLSPQAIRLIILTHTHYDHCGSLRALQELTEAKILVHADEAACLKQGYCEMPQGTRWFSKMIAAVGRIFAQQMMTYPPVEPDFTISERFDLQDYGINGYILPTPGHTSGSLSVILQDTHAIVGDTLFHIFKKSVFPPFANDQQELLKSWGKLLNTRCEHFYPGHGAPFRRELFKRSYEKALGS